MGLKTQRLGLCWYQEMKARVCYWETLQKVPPTQRHPPESLEPPTTFAGKRKKKKLLFLIKDSDTVKETARGGCGVSIAAGL